MSLRLKPRKPNKKVLLDILGKATEVYRRFLQRPQPAAKLVLLQELSEALTADPYWYPNGTRSLLQKSASSSALAMSDAFSLLHGRTHYGRTVDALWIHYGRTISSS